MWGRCNHQALGARRSEFGSPLVAEQDWPSGLGDEEKKVGSHAPKKNNGWLAGGRRKRVGGVLVCVLSLPFDGSVCRVLLLAQGLFSFVRAPCCRRRGSSSPSAAPLLSPAHAPGSAALFPAGSGARLAAKKFGVLWGRMSPKKRRSPPSLKEEGAVFGGGGLPRLASLIPCCKAAATPRPQKPAKKGMGRRKGLMCFVRRAAARAAGRVRGGLGSLAAFACCVRFFWLGRGVVVGGVPIPPNPSIKWVGGSLRCRKHLKYNFNQHALTIRQLENKFGGYEKYLYLCTVKPTKTQHHE